jgi:hypothetical protein
VGSIMDELDRFRRKGIALRTIPRANYDKPSKRTQGGIF